MSAKNTQNDFQKQEEGIVKKNHNKKVYFTIAFVFTAIAIGLIVGIFAIIHNCKKYEQKKDISITTDKTEYEQGEIVKITIENNSDKEREIADSPYSIEMFKNNDWIKIKQVRCPCNADCLVAGSFYIKAKNKLEYKWDQQESWCDDSVAMIYSKKISKQVPAGVYRVKGLEINMNNIDSVESREITYSLFMSNEFTIKEKATDTSD